MGIVLVVVAITLGVAYYTGALEPFIADLAKQVPGTGSVLAFGGATGSRGGRRS